MNFERLPEPFDVLVIKNVFDSHDFGDVSQEIKALTKNDMLNGTIWLHDLYKDLAISSVHVNTTKAYFNQEVLDYLENVNSLYGTYGFVNNHSTNVKYYGQSESSILHFDSAAFTVMFFMFDEPKGFNGGEVMLQIGGDIAYEQPVESNMAIIFPSSYYVGISEIDLLNKESQNDGLYVVTSYMFIES